MGERKDFVPRNNEEFDEYEGFHVLQAVWGPGNAPATIGSIRSRFNAKSEETEVVVELIILEKGNSFSRKRVEISFEELDRLNKGRNNPIPSETRQTTKE